MKEKDSRRTLSRARGFTLTELLVVIAIIGILAAMVFPAFARAVNSARAAACLSNLRQLAMAASMYSTDNSAFPDADTWVAELNGYVQKPNIFNCPADRNGAGYTSYVYDGQLVNLQGKGIPNSSVLSPSCVALLADGTSLPFPNGDVTSFPVTDNSGVLAPAGQLNASNHGINVAFIDTHIEGFSSKQSLDVSDDTSLISQAFYYGTANQWVNNPGAGVVPPTNFNRTTDTAPFTIAGSTSWAPIWAAAVAGWSSVGGWAANISTLQGSATFDNGDVGARSDPSQNLFATDAIGIIISRNSQLPNTPYSLYQIQSLFTGSINHTPNGHQINIYVRDMNSATRKWIDENLLFSSGAGYPSSSNPSPLPDGTYTDPIPGGSNFGTAAGANIIGTSSSADEILKVGNDPFGIGFASGAEMDPNQVWAVQLNINGVIQTWCRKSITAPVKQASDCLTAGHWALIRGISVVPTANTTPTTSWNGPTPGSTTAANDFLTYLNSAFKASLIMDTAFFPALSNKLLYPVSAQGGAGANGTAVISSSTWSN